MTESYKAAADPSYSAARPSNPFTPSEAGGQGCKKQQPLHSSAMHGEAGGAQQGATPAITFRAGALYSGVTEGFLIQNSSLVSCNYTRKTLALTATLAIPNWGY